MYPAIINQRILLLLTRSEDWANTTKTNNTFN